MGRKKTRMAFVVVFVSGIVVGMAGSRVVLNQVRANPEKLQRGVMRRLDRKLDLREDQYPLVKEEIHKTLLSLGGLHGRTQMEFIQIIDGVGVRLEAILDESQTAELSTMLEDIHAHLDARRMPMDGFVE